MHSVTSLQSPRLPKQRILGLLVVALGGAGTLTQLNGDDAREAVTVPAIRSSASIEIIPRPVALRHARSLKKRDVEAFPAIAKHFEKVTARFQSLEKAAATTIKEVENDDCTVIAVHIPAPKGKQLTAMHAALESVSKRFPHPSQPEQKVIDEEKEILLEEFMRYPLPEKVVIFAHSKASGRKRLIERYARDLEKPALADEGNIVHYGNDFEWEDREIGQNTSWASKRYRNVFDFNEANNTLGK